MLVDQGCYSLTSFLVGMLVARSCAKDKYAQYVLGFSLVAFFQTAVRSLISVPFTVLSARQEPSRRAQYTASAMVQQLAASMLVAAGLLVAAAISWSVVPSGDMATVLIGASAAAVGVLLRDFVRAVQLARVNIKGCLTLGLAANGLTIAAVVAVYLAGELTIPLAFGLLAGGSGLPAAILWLTQRKHSRLNARCIISDTRMNWRFGRWTLLAVIANSLCVRALPWLVLLWCSRQTVAALGVVVALAGVVNPITLGAAEYLMAYLSNRRGTAGMENVAAAGLGIIKYIAAVCAIYVAAVAVWGDWLTGVLFTSAYRGHGLALTIMSLAVAVEALNAPLRALLRVADRPHKEFHSSIVACGVSLVVASAAVPTLGLTGAVLAVVANRVCLIALNWVFLSRELGRNNLAVAWDRS